MSLQTHGRMSYFAHLIREVWREWDTPPAQATPVPQHAAPGAPPPGLAATPEERRQTRLNNKRTDGLKNALRLVTPFLPQFNFAPVAMRWQNRNRVIEWGAFERDTWTMKVNSHFWRQDDWIYGEFLEICSMLYHEARHAEQFFRIAQGVACNQLEFPSQGNATLQTLAGNAPAAQGQVNGVRNLVDRFQAMARQGQRRFTPGTLGSLLGIPNNVAQAAINNAGGNFDAYRQLGAPAWFNQRTPTQEVSRWMLLAYGSRRTTLDYLQDPMEIDAFAIERPVSNMIQAMIGVSGYTHGNRNRSDPVFAHLPTN